MGIARTCASYAAMILIQLMYGGSTILLKIALGRGLSQLVFILYRHVIAMLILAPLAYVFERKQRPPLTFSLAIKIFVLASLGTTIHLNLYYYGLSYTSATVASALNNVIPGLTFLLAVLLGMEKVMIRRAKGLAKIIGTLICIGGAMTFTFWKGGYLFKGFTDTPLIHIYSTKTTTGPTHYQDDWIKGAALILIANAAFSAWLVLQAIICKMYPAQLSLNTLICFTASVQSFVVALVFERNAASWKLEWNLQLLAIIYSGVLSSALVYFLQTWVISEKGPVFTAIFTPLPLIIVALFSAIAFAERVHLGSLIGAIFIVIGLYAVLWGKSKDDYVKEKWIEESFVGDQKVGIPAVSNGTVIVRGASEFV
ncbi:hypothetical protein ACHQM5_012039 [Ranunculus cassubicifolius]